MLNWLAPTDSTAHDAHAPPEFVCSWTNTGLGAAWLHLAGELDLVTAPQLERALTAPGLPARLVVLDMRELRFMDSSGLHVIVDASKRARQAGCRLILLRGRRNVDRMFTLTGSADEVEIDDIDPAEPAVQVLLKLARADRPL